METKDTQVCSKCGDEFPLDEKHFRRQSKNKTGFKYVCRGCDDDYQQERYKQNRLKIIAQATAYKEKQKESKKAQHA